MFDFCRGDRRRHRGSRLRCFKPQIAHFAALGAELRAAAADRAHPRSASGRAGDPRRQARRHRQHRAALRGRGLRSLRRRRGHAQSLPRPRFRAAFPGSRRQGRGAAVPHLQPGRAAISRTWTAAARRCTSASPRPSRATGTATATACWWPARPGRRNWPRCARSSATCRSWCRASARRAATSRRWCANGKTADGDGLLVSSSPRDPLRRPRRGFRRCRARRRAGAARRDQPLPLKRAAPRAQQRARRGQQEVRPQARPQQRHQPAACRGARTCGSSATGCRASATPPRAAASGSTRRRRARRVMSLATSTS